MAQFLGRVTVVDKPKDLTKATTKQEKEISKIKNLEAEN
jgi:hypothetical protein